MHTPEGRQLFAEYRAAPEGPRKQRLLNLLIVNNEPLAKLIIGQLCGFAESTKRKGFRAMGGCQGFHKLGATLEGQEQAIQQGRIALGRALAKFDPSRGCAFSYVVKLWCRDQLQQFVRHGQDLVRVPHDAAEEGVGVTLLGERDLDVRAGGGEDADLLRVSGGGDDFEDARQRLTDEDIERWEETGELPEWARGMRAEAGASSEPAKLDIESAKPESAIERFLATHLVFRPPLRVAHVSLFSRWESFAMSEGVFASAAALREALHERGARRVAVRVPWEAGAVAGYARVGLM